ncbi:unnamed protein product [Owenia fusiformis]|uniref:Uncharacterized protein n=1 Tax=Owenia fusiformis TaxID=6347 RepID=A0A8S4MZK4_OWEFU|nr:unnamed protein product [Owenia fusiformis]
MEKALNHMENIRPTNERKANKPLMEKRRRARINNCLAELKSIVLEALKKDPARYSKLEKADILEMTVQYLQTVHKPPVDSAAPSQAPSRHSPDMFENYSMGYNSCVRETIRYMDTIDDGIDVEMKDRISGHLSKRTQNVDCRSVSPSVQKPISIDIPSSPMRGSLITERTNSEQMNAMAQHNTAHAHEVSPVTTMALKLNDVTIMPSHSGSTSAVPISFSQNGPTSSVSPLTLTTGQMAYLIVGTTNIVPGAQITPTNTMVVTPVTSQPHHAFNLQHGRTSQSKNNSTTTPSINMNNMPVFLDSNENHTAFKNKNICNYGDDKDVWRPW